MPEERPRSSFAASLVRGGIELLVALVFLADAAETYAHRTFSEDPRYKVIVTAFAILIGTLGLLPAVFHASPRAGRVAFLAWLGCLALLFITGFATRP